MEEYQYPTGNGDETATELVIDPTKFRDVVSADLPQRQSDVYGLLPAPDRRRRAGRADHQGGLEGSADLGCRGDRRASPPGSNVVRSMARRADATITEIEGSHVIMISQPDTVTDVILAARKAVSEGC